MLEKRLNTAKAQTCNGCLNFEKCKIMQICFDMFMTNICRTFDKSKTPIENVIVARAATCRLCEDKCKVHPRCFLTFFKRLSDIQEHSEWLNALERKTKNAKLPSMSNVQ